MGGNNSQLGSFNRSFNILCQELNLYYQRGSWWNTFLTLMCNKFAYCNFKDLLFKH